MTRAEFLRLHPVFAGAVNRGDSAQAVAWLKAHPNWANVWQSIGRPAAQAGAFGQADMAARGSGGFNGTAVDPAVAAAQAAVTAQQQAAAAAAQVQQNNWYQVLVNQFTQVGLGTLAP
jgi:uncharacterized protein HemY